MAPYAAEGCKLFVYGISQHISNDELIEEFGKFGSVNDTYNTGKGYAFVTYDNSDDAADATVILTAYVVYLWSIYLLFCGVSDSFECKEKFLFDLWCAVN